MKILSSVDHVRILAILSDQIWKDYDCGIIDSIEYVKRINVIREEFNQHARLPFSEMSNIVGKVGYLLIENKNSFGLLNKYTIAKN